MEPSWNTVKLAQHNEISPKHCVVVISLCRALLGHHNIYKEIII